MATRYMTSAANLCLSAAELQAAPAIRPWCSPTLQVCGQAPWLTSPSPSQMWVAANSGSDCMMQCQHGKPYLHVQLLRLQRFQSVCRPLSCTCQTLQADVASFYTVDVQYHSGKQDSAKALEASSTCSTSAKDLLGGSSPAAGTAYVVRCPSNCAAQTDAMVYTSNEGSTYLYLSSICRAAIRQAKIQDESGGLVMVTLVAGSDLAGRDFSQGGHP